MSDSSLNLFQQPRALDSVAHRQLRYSASQPYHFAARQLFAPLVLGEVKMAAREYAIVFSDQAGSLPLALLGRERGHNAYVRTSGYWTARYVPAHFRRYPFIMAEAPASSPAESASSVEYMVLVDTAAPHLNEENGERLFTDDGQPTPILLNIQRVLGSMEQDSRRTLKAIKQLEELELLVAQQVVLEVKNGKAIGLDGLRVVDFKRLQALTPEQLESLNQSGALELVYAHRLSLTNLRDSALLESESKEAAPGSSGSVSFDGIDWSKF